MGARNLKRRKSQPIRHADVVFRFSQRLKSLREERKLSQRQLAAASNIHTTYLSRLESGRSAPGIDLVERLAVALGTRLSDLLPTDTIDPTAMLKERVSKQMDTLIQRANAADLNLLSSMLALISRDAARRRSE